MEPTAKSKIEKICYCNCGINLAAASVLALLLWMAADFRESKQQPAASTPHGCGSLGNERNLYRSRGPTYLYVFHLLLPKLLNFYYQYQALLGIFKQIIGQKFKSLAPKCKKILIGPLQA